VYYSAQWLLPALQNHVAPAINAWDGDGDVDWIAAKTWRVYNPFSPEGQKRAGVEAYGIGHPPTTTFWFLPFRSMDPRQLHQVSGLIVLGLLLLHLYLTALQLRAPLPLIALLWAVSFVLVQRWMYWHLQMVQLGEPIAFLYLLSWLFLRQGREWEGGAAIGLAGTLKLFPGVMFAFLALTRRWKALGVAVATWGAVAVYMTIGFGEWACWPQYFARQPLIANTWMHHIRNSSLFGIVQRWWNPACFPHTGVVPVAKWLAVLISLAILAGLWWISRREAARPETIDAPFAAFAVASVFLNVWVWEHYYVLVLTPLAVAAAQLRDLHLRGMRWWWTALGAATVYLVLWTMDIDPELKSHPAIHDQYVHLRMHLYEIANWIPWVATLILLAALIVAADRRNRTTASS
jgi:Glycosyltransferase family 87